MSDLLELLEQDFIRHGVYAGLLASVLCGVVGTFVVVKRLVFISGGISHAAFGGLGICYYLGLDHRIGATAVAILTAVLLGGGWRHRGTGLPGRSSQDKSQDALIGILWAAGMAVGIVFIDKTPGYAPNLVTYLFGNILAVDRTDLLLTSGLVVVVLAVLALYFKELVAVAFDEEFAAVQGVPVGAVMTLLMILIALSVVFLIQVVGIILVIALLTIPPVISLMFVRSFAAVLLLSTLFGCVITLGGLGISYGFDLPSGSAIVLLGTSLVPLVALARFVRSRSRIRHLSVPER